mmetsp:Transcript_52555/g.119725  ORF Transcript_52555/g.119725 Transcript_52555/m.119725 type:complete len:234 (-) Transcript_52555:33-734(-)
MAESLILPCRKILSDETTTTLRSAKAPVRGATSTCRLPAINSATPVSWVGSSCGAQSPSTSCTPRKRSFRTADASSAVVQSEVPRADPRSRPEEVVTKEAKSTWLDSLGSLRESPSVAVLTVALITIASPPSKSTRKIIAYAGAQLRPTRTVLPWVESSVTNTGPCQANTGVSPSAASAPLWSPERVTPRRNQSCALTRSSAVTLAAQPSTSIVQQSLLAAFTPIPKSTGLRW